MQELRLVAVSEDGSYAVLAVPGRGGRFSLPIDDRLRIVARGQFSRLAQYEIEVESPLRPKEIQDRIRAGETAEEIADAAGVPIERVRRFEGPVLAERAYRAQEAQRATHPPARGLRARAAARRHRRRAPRRVRREPAEDAAVGLAQTGGRQLAGAAHVHRGRPAAHGRVGLRPAAQARHARRRRRRPALSLPEADLPALAARPQCGAPGHGHAHRHQAGPARAPGSGREPRPAHSARTGTGAPGTPTPRPRQARAAGTCSRAPPAGKPRPAPPAGKLRPAPTAGKLRPAPTAGTRRSRAPSAGKPPSKRKAPHSRLPRPASDRSGRRPAAGPGGLPCPPGTRSCSVTPGSPTRAGVPAAYDRPARTRQCDRRRVKDVGRLAAALGRPGMAAATAVATACPGLRVRAGGRAQDGPGRRPARDDREQPGIQPGCDSAEIHLSWRRDQPGY